MGLLLDSDVIIDHLNNKSDYLSSIISISKEGLFMSIINWSEITYGIRKLKDPTKATKQFTNFIIELDIKILDLDLKIADKFLDLKIDLEKKGTRLEDFDLIIGATAMVNNITLITRNTNHFSRIPNLLIYPN
ncbi:MAG: type II toxin-antitoxin system VapC family toxin [bacterium]|nr:MAG: type II toxin-antitoxin system VapC family toxin [bacterium]